jgi:hypothetical protein
VALHGSHLVRGSPGSVFFLPVPVSVYKKYSTRFHLITTARERSHGDGGLRRHFKLMIALLNAY